MYTISDYKNTSDIIVAEKVIIIFNDLSPKNLFCLFLVLTFDGFLHDNIS